MNTDTTNEYTGPRANDAAGPVGDFSPPRIPKGKWSLTRIYTGVFLLSLIVLAWALTPGGLGAVPASLVVGFPAAHVLLRRGAFWRPAPNPFRRRSMIGPAAAVVAAVAAVAIALPGAVVVGLMWLALTALVALQNRFGLDTSQVVGPAGALILIGMTAAASASYVVARRLFPPTADA